MQFIFSLIKLAVWIRIISTYSWFQDYTSLAVSGTVLWCSDSGLLESLKMILYPMNQYSNTQNLGVVLLSAITWGDRRICYDWWHHCLDGVKILWVSNLLCLLKNNIALVVELSIFGSFPCQYLLKCSSMVISNNYFDFIHQYSLWSLSVLGIFSQTCDNTVVNYFEIPSWHLLSLMCSFSM